jgi:hypothetical protein
MGKIRKPTSKDLGKYKAANRPKAGKGDKPRPTDAQKYGENFDNIFGKKPFPWEKKKL